MSNNTTIRQMTAVPPAERDRALYLSRSSPPPSQVAKLIPTLPSIISNSVTHIQSLDSEISTLRAKLRALEQNRAEWSEHQSCCQSLLAPIRSLPTELLLLIFENLILYAQSYHSNDDVPDTDSALTSISSVSHVSYLWRSVAIAFPRLWSTIRLAHHTTWPYIQEMVLPRTMQCGLDLTIVSGNSFSLHSHHLQRLCILETYHQTVIPDAGWPNLVDLDIYGWSPQFNEMFSIAPKLHTVALSMGRPMEISQISLPWVQIRFLTIRWAGPQDLDDVLLMVSNVEGLTVVAYFQWDLRSSEPTPIVSPMLRTLEYQVRPRRAMAHLPFRSLTMPNLHALRFTKDNSMDCRNMRVRRFLFPLTSDFRTFQERSQCRILVLSITNLPFLAIELVEFINLIPTLQELTIVLGKAPEGTIAFDDKMFLASLDATQSRPIPILPNLKSLTFEHTVVSEDLLVNAILSRQYPNGGDSSVSCLDFLSVVVTTHVFNRAVIDPLVGLRAGGLRLILEDTSSRY